MRRAAKILGVTLAALVLLVLLAAGFLLSPWGNQLVRRAVMPKVNALLAGDVEVARLRFSFHRVVLYGVVLRDPDGERVASAEKIGIAFSPLALLDRRLDLAEVEIQEPKILLVLDELGSNLQRAIAAKERKTNREKSDVPRDDDGEPLLIVVRDLEVHGGTVDVRMPPGKEPLRYWAENLEAKGEGRFDGAKRSFGAKLALRGSVRAPLAAPLRVDLEGEGEGEAVKGSLRVVLGQSVLDATVEGASARQLGVHLRQLVLTPPVARVLTPRYPLIAAVEGRGTVRRQGPVITSDLALRAGQGRLTARGQVDLDRMWTEGFKVEGEHLDLSKLLAGGPRSDLGFSLEARGGGRSLAALEGEARLEVPPARMEGRRVGPVRLHARARRRTYNLLSLDARLPGLIVRARGTLAAQRLAGRATVTARNLSELRRTLDGPGGPTLPPLSGHGRLDVTVDGTVDQPGLTMAGRFPVLVLAGTALRSFSVDARFPDLRRPQHARGRLAVERVLVGDRGFREVRADVASAPGGPLSVVAQVAAPSLALRAQGRWDARGQTLALSQLALGYPEARWQSTQPAVIHIGQDGDLRIESLRLAAGKQRLAVDVQRAPNLIAGEIAVDDLDLALLPRAFLPPRLSLGGRFDARVRLSGTAARPTASATLALANGRFRDIEDIDLELTGRYARARAEGTLALAALGAALKGRFDLPTRWPPPSAAPLRLEASLTGLDLRRAQTLVRQEEKDAAAPPWQGQADLRIDLTGTARAPRLDVRAKVAGVQVRSQKVGDVVLTGRVKPGRPIEAHLAIDALGRSSRASVSIELPTARLLSRPPTAEQIQSAPFEADAHLDRLPLAALAALAGRPEEVSGTLALEIRARGSLLSPRGELTLTLDDLAAPRFPPTDVTLKATADDGPKGASLVVKLIRKAQELAALTATLDLPSRRLADRRAVLGAPLTIDAHLGPVDLQKMGIPPEHDREPPRVLQGRAEARLSLRGSLADPRLRAEVAATNVELSGEPLGQAKVALRYEERRPRMKLELLSKNGGRLDMDGEARVDLGYHALTRGLAWRRVPIEGHLTARRFDLKALSGMVNDVLAVAGTLSADGRVKGPAGAPQIEGRIELADGRVLVAGKGDYRDIHLLLRGDERTMVLEDLSAKSGGGWARVHGQATRRNDSLRLTARTRLSDFPVYSEGQAFATLSLDAQTQGTASTDKIDLTTAMNEGHLQLLRGRRRQVHDLSRPEDVVFFSKGEPLNRGQARKHQRLIEAWQRGAEVGDAKIQAQKNEAEREREAAKNERVVRVAIKATRNLWVRGPDANLELGLSPSFMVTMTDEPRVFGTVVVHRGQIEVFGRRFRVAEDSTARFVGPPDAPVLDVKATHEARKAGMTVVARVTGPVDALSFSLTSPEHPEYGEAQVFAVLLTGRAPDEASGPAPGAAARASSIVGGVIAGRIQEALAERLPVDVLNIDAIDGTAGLRLEAGTYVGDDLYLSYVAKLGAPSDPFRRENRSEVHLEYQLSRRWSLEGVYGDARQGSADIVWTKHY